MKFRFTIGHFITLGILTLSAAAQSFTAANTLSSYPSAQPPTVSLSSGQYLGSVSTQKLRPETINLSFQDALERGLKVNLGLFVSGVNSDRSRAERWKALSELLPHLDGSLREATERINPRALGIPLANIPRTVDVSNSDARLNFTQSLVDLPALSREHAARSAEDAAHSDYRDARETVVIAVSNAYLSAIEAQARLDFTEADLRTAESLYQLAKDREHAGLTPEVDVLRAQVEWQSRQERVIEAKNAVAKQTMVLLRLVGLDVHQQVRLTTAGGYEPTTLPSSSAVFSQALQFRQDYKSAQEQLQSAKLSKRSAEYERAPRIGFVADYGALGTAPGNAVPTWNVAAVLHVPVFEGGRIKADVADADAALRQKEAEVEDTRTRIAQEVENALLDLKSASEQVEVAKSTLVYANRTLIQSRDRFGAGVTNNIEVIQAQEALAGANEQWVTSLYAYNIAKVLLSRATGTAEQTSKNLFSSARATQLP